MSTASHRFYTTTSLFSFSAGSVLLRLLIIGITSFIATGAFLSSLPSSAIVVVVPRERRGGPLLLGKQSTALANHPTPTTTTTRTMSSLFSSSSSSSSSSTTTTTTPGKREIEVIHQPDETFLEKKGVYSWGTWGCGVSRFPWTYGENESCYLLSGKVTVTPTDGRQPVTVGKGDFVTFPAGMSCTWDVTEPVKKHFNFF